MNSLYIVRKAVWRFFLFINLLLFKLYLIGERHVAEEKTCDHSQTADSSNVVAEPAEPERPDYGS
jgi:hypothetical protein